MGITEVANIISRIADGLKDACVNCLQDNSDVVVLAISEQLFCGLDADENYLDPNYDNDPYFEEEKSPWYHRAKAYKEWKHNITPPQFGTMLGLSPRPDNVPNLWIDGTFHGQINAQRIEGGLNIDPGNGRGPDIVAKYEVDNKVILDLGPTAMRYFNEKYMIPAISKFFKDCGYK